MQTQPNRVKEIISVIILLIAWGIAAVVLLVGKQVSWSQMLLGVTAGLVVWLCTYVVANWVDPSTKSHYRTTTEIYDVVTGKYMSLVDERRKSRDSIFYSRFYGSARTMKISGIANQAFFGYLTSRDCFKSDHLLQIMTRKPVIVEAVIMSPSCEIIDQMNKREPRGRRTVHSDNIRNVLMKLKDLHTTIANRGLNLVEGSRLDVRLCSRSLNTTLFYADGSEDDENRDEILSNGILLMGMLWTHKPGEQSQLFRVPKNEGKNGLHEDCVRHFDELFRLCENEQIFSLEFGGRLFFDEQLYQQVSPAT